MISSIASLKSFLHSHSIHSFYPPSVFPPWSLVFTQNTPDYTNAKHCNPIPSSLIFTLLNMHPHFKARIPLAIIILRHQPFISPLQNCLAKLLAQRKDFQQQAKFYKNRPLHLSICLSSPCLLIIPCSTNRIPRLLWSTSKSLRFTRLPFFSSSPMPLQFLSTTFNPSPALLPSTSPHQYSSILHHHSRRLFPAFHNTPTKKKASPCIVYNSNGEIPAAKMTANKSKSKPQKHVVFTPVRWPIVRSQ